MLIKKDIFLFVLIIILFNVVTLGVQDSNKIKAPSYNSNFMIYHTPPSDSYLDSTISVISALVSIASIFIVLYNVRTQIRASEKNLIKQFRLNDRAIIREYIAKLLVELSKPDKGAILKHTYVSEEHILLEKQLGILLNRNDQAENDFITCITKYHNDKIENKNAWVKEIENLAQNVINKKMD